MKRGEAEDRVRALGGSVKASVVKDLSFLVTNDPESGSGKNKKARSQGTPVIDEAEFLSILANPQGGGLNGVSEPHPRREGPKEVSPQGELFETP
jgi:DNA ligase (NAD+)